MAGLMTRTISNWAVCLSVLLPVVGLAACDQPAGPSQMPQPAAPTGPQVRLSGLVVDGGDEPVPGARIAVQSVDGGTLVETVADAAGAYAFAIERLDRIVVTVQKDGFEPSRVHFTLVASVAAEVTAHLRLHQIVRISAGESISLATGEDSSVCYDAYEMDDWTCRKVRVISPSAGQLTIETAIADAQRIRLQVPGRMERGASTLRLTVGAGSETTVDVQFLLGASETTLYTSLVR